MATPRGATQWSDFAWQGFSLQVPEAWNLGRMEGDRYSGYARLDDPEIVRVELEWRTVRAQATESVEALVGRYLDSLEKKAGKGGLRFAARRRVDFLRERRFAAGPDCETFTWEADFRAHNLAWRTPGGRIVLLRLLSRLDERPSPVLDRVFASLGDHAGDETWPWSVYGMRFAMPAAFTLESHKLHSGHLQLTFERGKEQLRVQRLSLANLLLKGATLAQWYPAFFCRDLRDLETEIGAGQVGGHAALEVSGRPRSRWRQLLRPLPWINPRPRLYLDARVWSCPDSDKICLVDHLFRQEADRGDLAQRLADGYVCHQQNPQAESGVDAQLPADAE